MRAPQRYRPSLRKIHPLRPDVDMDLVAERSSYVGSPEHKDMPSFAGRPRPRADASICDRAFADRQTELTDLLRDAIRRRVVGHPWEGGYPRYVWASIDGEVYEARLVNQGTGEYKGYMLTRSEWPEGMVGVPDGA